MKDKLIELFGEDCPGNLVFTEYSTMTDLDFVLVEGSPYPKGSPQRKDHLASIVFLSADSSDTLNKISDFKARLANIYRSVISELDKELKVLDRRTRKL